MYRSSFSQDTTVLVWKVPHTGAVKSGHSTSFVEIQFIRSPEIVDENENEKVVESQPARGISGHLTFSVLFSTIFCSHFDFSETY